MNDMHNYSMNKQRAIAEMLDMNKRATKPHYTQNGNIFLARNFSFDSDTIVILALMFILYNDNADMLLVFALAYILI